MKGRNRLISIVRKLIVLSEEDTCGWTDEQFNEMANSLDRLIQLNSKAEVSRDGAARLLGCSTRTLQRKVNNGEIPPPHRNGDKSGTKYYVDDLEKE